jgi:hypothetical protein
VEAGAIMGTSADSKKYRVGSRNPSRHVYLRRSEALAQYQDAASRCCAPCARIMIVVLSRRAAGLTLAGGLKNTLKGVCGAGGEPLFGAGMAPVGPDNPLQRVAAPWR